MIAPILTCLTILGTWQYAGFRYDGNFYSKTDPHLILRFNFREDLTAHLIWYRENETGFCERTALYRFENDQLHQKTNWVNPKNEPECASDPDMQPNRETITDLRCEQNTLGFRLELNGKEFLYILERVTP